jgi:ATP-dependent Clp protease ATP-binding subunit ClpA
VRHVGAGPRARRDVGYEEAGQLTETVRRKPYCVLLLDEIEKAHADVFNILLQLLDDGRLTDAQGRTVDFTNTVVIIDQLSQITRLLLDRVSRRLHAQGVELEITDEAVELLANAGFDPQYGARPLRRAIQRLLEDTLSERLLSGDVAPGQRVRVLERDGQLDFEVLGSASQEEDQSEELEKATTT